MYLKNGEVLKTEVYENSRWLERHVIVQYMDKGVSTSRQKKVKQISEAIKKTMEQKYSTDKHIVPNYNRAEWKEP